jgi:ABC-2 type transport system ATP-binding protein
MDHARDGKQIRSRVAYVPDEPRFHEDIKLEHLKQATAPFYPGWDEKRFVALVDAFDLPLDRKFKKLSAGMKTKFALALALSQGAELLLLDEPTSGLDPAFRRDLLKLLGELLQDDRITVLFSTHLTADLERTADYITFVRDGHVVFSKPKDVVLDTWVLVKGGPELIRDDAGSGFIGIRRGPHGFEAITDDAAAVRARFGDSVVVERPSLEDIVLLTTSSGDLDA